VSKNSNSSAARSSTTSGDAHRISVHRTTVLMAVLVAVSSCKESGDPSGGASTDSDGSSSATEASGASTSESTSDGTTATDGSSDSTTSTPTACEEDSECDDGNPCNGVERCSAANVCEAGEIPDGPTACGEGMMCVDGDCFAAVCGNGIIEPGEHCDDGNTDTFDGCDEFCQYELFYRSYELNLMPSPAASFCDRPNSALGDALSSFALEANNADRKVRLDTGVENSIFQVLGLRDLSGMTNGTIEVRNGGGVLDPARGEWPTDGSNPIDWWFLLEQPSLDADGRLADRMEDVTLTGGTYVGGPGTTSRPIPMFVDSTTRGRFDYSTDPDLPGPPPDTLADGTVVPREVIGDEADQGICGNLTVAFLASVPADPALEDCLDCPGTSRVYTSCPGEVVTESCNSSLDPLIGGCVIGPNCSAGFQVVFPTQPDVDNGGPGTLAVDPDNLNKVPSTMTDDNLDGYSSYFTFRARRVHVTGTL
jgi:cysteine-rich repeat protein